MGHLVHGGPPSKKKFQHTFQLVCLVIITSAANDQILMGSSTERRVCLADFSQQQQVIHCTMRYAEAKSAQTAKKGMFNFYCLKSFWFNKMRAKVIF